jgi:hypothetical protein
MTTRRLIDVDITDRGDGKLPVWDAATGTHVYENAGAASAPPDLYIGSMHPAFVEDTIGPGANNRTILHRIVVGAGKTVSAAHFRVTTQSGNMSVQIFSEDLATIHAATGSFAMPATGNRSQAFGSSYALSANTVYYIAVGLSSSTARLTGEAGVSGMIATGGWNVHGYSDTAFPLTAAPTVTWETQQGIAAVYLF